MMGTTGQPKARMYFELFEFGEAVTITLTLSGNVFGSQNFRELSKLVSGSLKFSRPSRMMMMSPS